RLLSWEDRTPGPDYIPRGAGQARVVSVLKGHPPKSATVECLVESHVDPKGRQDLLLFFDDSLRVDYAISLSDSNPFQPAIGPALALLRGRHDILETVDRRLRRMRREGRGRAGTAAEADDRKHHLQLAVPGWPEPCDSDDCPDFGDPVDFVIVPADSEWWS